MHCLECAQAHIGGHPAKKVAGSGGRRECRLGGEHGGETRVRARVKILPGSKTHSHSLTWDGKQASMSVLVPPSHFLPGAGLGSPVGATPAVLALNWL